MMPTTFTRNHGAKVMFDHQKTCGNPQSDSCPYPIHDHRWATSTAILVLAICLIVLPAGTGCSAEASGQNFRIRQQQGRISISATNANLKNVLLELSETADVTIRVAESLNRKVTLEQTNLSLKSALKRLLRGINHVIIYSGKNRKKASIAKVLVLSKATPSRPMTAAQKRLSRRIDGYQRQIDSMRRNMAKYDATSRQAKRYQRRIDSIQRKIDRYRKQMN